jgi:hypothetical protein
MAKKLTRAMEIATPSTEQIVEQAKASLPVGSEIRVIDGRQAVVKTKPNGDVEIHWLT